MLISRSRSFGETSAFASSEGRSLPPPPRYRSEGARTSQPCRSEAPSSTWHSQAPVRSNTSAFGEAHVGFSSEGDEEKQGCGHSFVLHKSNFFRNFWFILITVLLAYTGTIFMYRLCFIQFRIDPPADDPPEELQWEAPDPTTEVIWADFDAFVAVVFWFDLVANFFFSYENQDGKEVDDLRMIATHYLRTHFAINLTACIPEQVVEAMIDGATGKSSPNQGVRALRLQRISRLARLMRLTRLAKLRANRMSSVYQWFERQKGIRLVNLTFGLAWCVHILACGWYLIAALHDNPQDTWVYRRTVDHNTNISLVWRPPVDQWCHSMYFILTVFTTVGFGDISAVTLGEISYVCFTMAVGAVVHSIIISEVISVVTSSDNQLELLLKRRDLIEAFASHTQLGDEAQDSLLHWIDQTAKRWVPVRLDQEELKTMILGANMPRGLLGRLPSALYGGRLISNRFFSVCHNICETPPRLPMLLAMSAKMVTFNEREVVYQFQDYPVNLFLVLTGTFAYVAKPDRNTGGRQITPHVRGFDTRAHGSPKGLGHVADKLMSFRPRPSVAGPDQSRKLSQELSSSSESDESLFPFVLFGAGSYFGDIELLRNLPRTATARCETDEGKVLTVSKADFTHLVAEFPQFATEWVKASIARNEQRKGRQSLLVRGLSYRPYAATIIQHWYRRRTHRPDPMPSGRLNRKRDAVDVLRRFHDSVNEGGASDSYAMLNDTSQAMLRELKQEMRAMSGGMAAINRRIDELFDVVGRIERPDSQTARVAL